MSEPFIGEIKPWAINFVPKGWAICGGQLLNISQNQPLYSLLGTTYGGDGRTTFALPDLRGRVAVHAGEGLLPGQKGGLEGVTLQTDQMPTHSHIMQAHNGEANVHSPNASLLASNETTAIYAAVNGSNLADMEQQTVSQGSGQSHMNIQPSTVVNFYISLYGIFPSRN